MTSEDTYLKGKSLFLLFLLNFSLKNPFTINNMRKCSVLGCAGVKNNPNIPFFKIPSNNIEAWNEAISKANNQITNVKLVCADHFLPSDLISTYAVPHDIIEVSKQLK